MHVRAFAVLVIVAASLIVLGQNPVRAHGGEISVVVEALAHDEPELGTVDYALKLVFEDGDPVAEADVTITSDPSPGATIDSTVETVPGTYIARAKFPAEGVWRLTILFDHPDGSGSVEFSQEIRRPAPQAPVVMVDTEDPNRVGTVADQTSSILSDTGPSASTGSSFPIIVEAFIADANQPLVIEYAVAVDRGPDSDIALVLAAISDRGAEVAPTELSFDGQIHRTTIDYPDAGIWSAALTVTTAREDEVVGFAENLPWPHYTTEAGTPKVKVDSRNPEREGLLVTDPDSIYLATPESTTGGPTSTTTSSTPASTSRTQSETDNPVVVDITTPAEELTQNIGLRLFHLATIALWIIPVGAALLGTTNKWWLTISLIGMGLTLGSGTMLMLWGAPVSFPGILRWEELSSRLFGTPYQLAFLIKMGTVAIAVTGTVQWARQNGKRPLSVIIGSFIAATIAVTAMTQFHTFTHL